MSKNTKYINYINELELLNDTINDNLNIEILKKNGVIIKNEKQILKKIKKSIKKKIKLQEKFNNVNHINDIEKETEKLIFERNRLYKKCEQLKHKLKTNGIIDKQETIQQYIESNKKLNDLSKK